MTDPRSEKEVEAAEKLLTEVAILQVEGLSLGEVLADALADYPNPLNFLRKADVGTVRAELVRKRLARELARFRKKCRKCGEDLGTDAQALSLGFCSGTCARTSLESSDEETTRWCAWHDKECPARRFPPDSIDCREGAFVRASWGKRKR